MRIACILIRWGGNQSINLLLNLFVRALDVFQLSFQL